MAAQSNGRAKKSKKPTQNGSANGHPNGHMNGHTEKTNFNARSSRVKPSRSVIGSFTSIVSRLSVWYLIITIAFRCPPSISQLSDNSPKLCKPYLQGRSYVAPYLDPYYQTYVAPQVEKVQPYIDRFESQFYTPAATFTKDKYATYGAHRVDQAQNYMETQWGKTARPQIQKLQGQAKSQYDLHLSPHVKKASDAAGPYYQQTKNGLLEVYHLTLLPTYKAALPYSKQAYAYGQYAVVRVIFPYVRSAKDLGWAFVSRTVWPQVRVLYGDNVEPQLVRIGERLGRHRDQQKIESAVEAFESETPTSSETQTTEVASSAANPSDTPSGSGWEILNDLWPSEALSTATEQIKSKTATQPPEPKLTGEELREKLNNDLRQWQTKFAVAADKGSEDLEQRVAEITERQVQNGVKGHGAALVIQLEETANSTVDKFKHYILQTVRAIPEDASEQELESAYEKSVAKTRELGAAVKDRAQAIRAWKAGYDQETDSLVKAAVESTVEVLDRIHGLGLQEVGMRWAWLDGVTYKDWQNYHKLRNTLTEWQEEVEAVGSRHEGLKIAHQEAKTLEDNAMEVASKMVAELVRLKDVSRWKIWASDTTDDFSNRAVPARAHKAAKNIADNVEGAASKASSAIVGSETPATESIASAVSEKVAQVSKASESVVGSQVSNAKSIASEAKKKVATASSKVSEAVVSSESKVEDATSDAKEKAASASSKATETVLGSETKATSVASVLKEEVAQASSKASEAVVGSNEQAMDDASNVAEKVTAQADEADEAVKQNAPVAVPVPKQKKVLGGANAQVIAEAKEIIFDDVLEDDDETYSQKIQNMVAGAGDRAADLTRAVSEALLRPSSTQGTVASVTSLANEQYAAALAAASNILYGTQQQPIESLSSVASDKYAAAVTAASYAIYGTPTPTAIIKTIQVQASSRYEEAVRLANEQYSNAKSQFSELVSGKPQPAHQTLLSYIEKAYSDSVAGASEKFQAALQYTDTVKSYAAGPTQGYFESVSSVAASKLSEGLSAASAQFSSQPTPAYGAAQRQYYEALGLAHARYSDFLGAASTAVYGAPQGTLESIVSVASGSAASVASVASASAASIASAASANAASLALQGSSVIIGTETPWAQSVASEVSQSAQSVASKASEQAENVASQVSSGVYGSDTPWAESVATQASQNWEALIAKASSQVYGAPTPWAESAYSQAGAYGAQATAQVVQQYAALQAIVSELVVGKEPDFTESVMNRFSSAYYTGFFGAYEAASSYASENIEAASSYAGETYDSATSYAADAYSSASSVVSSVFTPPPAIETILSQANDQINAAVESASVALYGTEKGTVEQATESAASVYSSIQSKASEAIYGTKQAQDSFTAVAASAQAAISEAIFGTPTPTGYVASASSGAEDVYNSISSVAGENAAAAASAISSAIYGPEQGAVESASNKIAAAIEAANSRISEMYANAAKGAGDAASSASSVAAEATQRIKDEL